MSVREVKDSKGELLAIIVRWWFQQPGVTFFTEACHTQQLAFMGRKAGETVEAHCHREIPREISKTQEVLMIKRGKLKLSLFDGERRLVHSCPLETGDVVALINGGHSLEFLEDTDLIEVKQGPYLGKDDKVLYGNSENKVEQRTQEPL